MTIAFTHYIRMIFWIFALLTLLWIAVEDYRTRYLPLTGIIAFHLLSVGHAFFQEKVSLLAIVAIWVLSFCFWFFVKKTADFLLKKESIGGGDVLLFPGFSLWLSGIQYAFFLLGLSFFLQLTSKVVRHKHLPLAPSFFLCFFLFFIHIFLSNPQIMSP